MLHVEDLGLLRTFADNVHREAGQRSYRKNGPKSELMRVMNRRILNLPPMPRVHGFSPFRATVNEKQTPVTGAHWRSLVPFLWYVLLGINQAKSPDDDGIFICALLLDRYYAAVRQVNKSTDDSKGFTIAEINNIEKFANTCCQQIKDLFDLAETTKQHRTMSHLGE